LSIVLDELDKQILNYLSNGVYSYDDLAKSLNVTRGTIYRRMAKLEEEQIIKKKIIAIPNYAKLGVSAIFLGVDCNYEDIDRLLKKLETIPRVKGLWRAYGSHQIVAQLFCQTGCEGNAISEFHRALEEGYIKIVDLSIGFEWKKFNLEPF
jgi:DNA-binding Lrp family transcriptional regulator